MCFIVTVTPFERLKIFMFFFKKFLSLFVLFSPFGKIRRMSLSQLPVFSHKRFRVRFNLRKLIFEDKKILSELRVFFTEKRRFRNPVFSPLGKSGNPFFYVSLFFFVIESGKSIFDFFILFARNSEFIMQFSCFLRIFIAFFRAHTLLGERRNVIFRFLRIPC